MIPVEARVGIYFVVLNIENITEYNWLDVYGGLKLANMTITTPSWQAGSVFAPGFMHY